MSLDMAMQPPAAQPPPPHPADAVTATDVIVPILLTLICGVGGFAWGLIRLVQGRYRQGWFALGINAGLWLMGAIAWVTLVAGIAAQGMP